MIDYSKFGFDADAMRKFFEQADMTKMLGKTDLSGLDPKSLFAAQQKNMAALMEANKAATAGFQELFGQQVKIFEETMATAQKQVEELGAGNVDAPKSEAVQAAFEKAVGNMQTLSETAQQANSEAFEVVSARVAESVSELQKMVDKLKS